MTSPPSPSQPGEQIAFEDILSAYQNQNAELTHQLVLADCRIKNRDKHIEFLLAELEKVRELPDIPHH